MKRRTFLGMLVAGLLSLCTKTVHAEKAPDTRFTKAMFWKKVD